MTGAELELVGADEGLERAVRALAGERLRVVESIVDLSRLTECVLIVPEILSECEGLELVSTLPGGRVWFIASGNHLRDQASEAGVEHYFSLPLGREFELKVQELERPAPLISGNTGTLSLFSIVQFLSNSQVTGMLKVSSPRAELVFLAGQVIDSSTDEAQGESALYQVLRDASGEFTFYEEPVKEVEVAITKPTEHLLLAIASKLDEGKP